MSKQTDKISRLIISAKNVTKAGEKVAEWHTKEMLAMLERVEELTATQGRGMLTMANPYLPIKEKIAAIRSELTEGGKE